MVWKGKITSRNGWFGGTPIVGNLHVFFDFLPISGLSSGCAQVWSQSRRRQVGWCATIGWRTIGFPSYGYFNSENEVLNTVKQSNAWVNTIFSCPNFALDTCAQILNPRRHGLTQHCSCYGQNPIHRSAVYSDFCRHSRIWLSQRAMEHDPCVSAICV